MAIEEETPPLDARVFVGNSSDGRALILQVNSALGEEGRGRRKRTFLVRVCTLYAMGVTSEDMAAVLFPNNATGQQGFVSVPFAFSNIGSTPFTVGIARPATGGPYVATPTFAFFSVRAE